MNTNQTSSSSDSNFDYDEMTRRNIGFVTYEEQQRLKNACVFIAGVGGMGGAALAVLARSGIGSFIIADLDVFEVSNLNRQAFCTLDTVGQPKAEASRDALLRINPTCQVTLYGAEWTDKLDEIMQKADVLINGCDDVRATLRLLRAARGKKTVIDAFASTLPNVYSIGPHDPRPEEVFGYPSVGKDIASLDESSIRLCAQREIEWVMSSSSSADHVVMSAALEMVSGQRKRFSFAPMVWMTGCLMAYEAVRLILQKSGGAGVGGVFHNPWSHVVERPAPSVFGSIKRAIVRRVLQKMMQK